MHSRLCSVCQERRGERRTPLSASVWHRHERYFVEFPAEQVRCPGKNPATRRSIEAAAWKLFKAKGYQETTVDDIVAEVGISQRTFFRYFDSKEAVLFETGAGSLTTSPAGSRRPTTTRAAPGGRVAVLSLAHGMDRERRVVILRSSLRSPRQPSATTTANHPARLGRTGRALASRLDCDINLTPPSHHRRRRDRRPQRRPRHLVARNCAELLPELPPKPSRCSKASPRAASRSSPAVGGTELRLQSAGRSANMARPLRPDEMTSSRPAPGRAAAPPSPSRSGCPRSGGNSQAALLRELDVRFATVRPGTVRVPSVRGQRAEWRRSTPERLVAASKARAP